MIFRKHAWLPTLAALWSAASLSHGAGDADNWRVIIANDTCPDVTWGFTEQQTRQAFADLVRSHLDEMNSTDSAASDNRDHFNMATTQEALDFAFYYPARKEELIRRIREGRVCMSPFLCNSLWGFQSVEGAIRTLYPARRLERAWGIPVDVAEHIELPSLPWGMASILSGCGVRWLSNPFYDYDSAFKGLKNPPLFKFIGPDGGELRVLMDSWACARGSYAQGARLLANPKQLGAEWIPHYEQLGAAYPLKVVFASGTHLDISPDSWKQTHGFAESIAQFNATERKGPRLVNGTLAQFCREVDQVEQTNAFMPSMRGCFGHSWELWPVSLAKYASALRENERQFMASESLAALACYVNPDLAERTRADREKAEWYWAMLSDHAWNGTDANNKRHNAMLRRQWAEGLEQQSRSVARQAWSELGLVPASDFVTVFNPLSFARDCLNECEIPTEVTGVTSQGQKVTAQIIDRGGARCLMFVAGNVPAYGFREYRFESKEQPVSAIPFQASSNTLDGPFYRLTVDTRTGGLGSLVWKTSGQELIAPKSLRTVCQTVYFDGKENLMESVKTEVVETGPVLARLRVTGAVAGIRVTNLITLYATLDRVDFDVRIAKPVTTSEQRLLHFFPVSKGAKDLHIETTASILRPAPQPEGDLLPGADASRFAVQGFADYSPADGAGVSIASLDAFMLRLDQGDIAFEALGNDQNYKEVTQDQDGVTQFRFRYSMRAHAPGFDNAAVLSWSRGATTPSMSVPGRLPKKWLNQPWLEMDATRGVVTAFKPAEEKAALLVRVWESSGKSSPPTLFIPGCQRALQTDLLERDVTTLPVEDSKVAVPIRGKGFAAVRFHIRNP